MKGNVFDIRRFCIHDGPGIRTTVFLKGCRLDCPWCQNPEGRYLDARLWHLADKCIHCERCIQACPHHLLDTNFLVDGSSNLISEACIQCRECLHVCPANALYLDGTLMSSEEVLKEILHDLVFYKSSGGGVTLSGGDPLVQHEFGLEILRLCKDQGISTCMETCLHADWQVIEPFLDLVDCFIIDIKYADPALHKKTIGLDNQLILENFKRLAASTTSLLVRIPLIPGFTAVEENIHHIGTIVQSINTSIPIELVNYNPLCISKYNRMALQYPIASEILPYAETEMKSFQNILTEMGLHVAE